jgi:hypothetical protein
MSSDSGLSPLAHRFTQCLITRELAHHLGEMRGVLHDSSSVGGQKQLHRFPEVACVWPEQDRGTVRRRLDHVLTAPIREAAADKGDVSQTPAGTEFAESVEKEDRLRVES